MQEGKKRIEVLNVALLNEYYCKDKFVDINRHSYNIMHIYTVYTYKHIHKYR